MTADRHNFFWEWEEDQNKHFSEAHSEAASKTFWSCLMSH